MSSIVSAIRAPSRLARRHALYSGSALAALLSLAAHDVASAQSAEPCGPLQNGAVLCPVDPSLYPDGVAYEIESPSGDVTVGLARDAEIAAYGPGLVVSNPYGSVTIDAGQAHVVTSADNAIAVRGSSGAGSVTIDLGGAATWGSASHAVVAHSASGDVSVSVDEIVTFGDMSWGVTAVSDAGDVTIDIGSLSTFGDEATGIKAGAYAGDISVAAASLYTEGDGATAVETVNSTIDGHTVLSVGDVYTTGQWASGLVADALGSITIEVGSAGTEGNQSHAIASHTETGQNTVRAGSVLTIGHGSAGILANSLEGDVVVEAGSVRTAGAESHAIFVESYAGDVSVSAERVRSEGSFAIGVIAYSELGKATAVLGSVETLRDDSMGVVVGGGGGASVTVDRVITGGYGATGVQMVAGSITENGISYADAVLRAGTLETTGANAAGASVVAIGDADVSVGMARTIGEFSDAVAVYTRYGDSSIAVDRVETTGYRSSGVFAGSDVGAVALRLGSGSTSGDVSSVVQVVARNGDADILVLGPLSTTGGSSRGVISSSLNGDTRVVAKGPITTSGEFSQGIFTAAIGRTHIEAASVTTSGDFAIGIEAWSARSFNGDNNRSIDIVAGRVVTSGALSHGIQATNADDGIIISDAPAGSIPPPAVLDEPLDQDITVRAGAVAVTGQDAVGILVDGVADVLVEAQDVSSTAAEALRLQARGDIEARFTGVIVGGGAQTVSATGETVAVSLARTARVEGAGDALTLAAVGPWAPPHADGEVALPAPAGRVTLDNAGLIRAGTGAAVRVTAGTAEITNSGRIEGSLRLADGDDRIVNTGVHLVSADNDFGAGDDLYTNKGVVQFAPSTTPHDIKFLGLERFANDGGLIDLRNGRSGDLLTLTGAYAGSSDARLGLDVSGITTDRLVVSGAATGRTNVLLTSLTPASATLLKQPVRLISAGAGSSADAFRISNPDQGLVRYGLSFDKTTNAYSLDATAGRAVDQSLGAIEGLDATWRASADAYTAELALARAAGGEAPRVWAQAHGAQVEREDDTGGEPWAYDQTIVGGQTGYAFGTRPLAGGHVVLGVTGGYARSELEFSEGGQSQTAQSFNAGFYGAWSRDNLFATGLVKVDRHRMEIDDTAAGLNGAVDGVSWGARLDAGYRFDLGSVVLEPVAGLDYVSTSLDDLEALGQSVSFDDRAVLSGRVGVTALTRHDLTQGRVLTLTAGLHAAQQFGPKQRATLHSAGETDSVERDGGRTSAGLALAAQLELGGGLQTYIESEARIGDGLTGGGIRIGARYRF